MVMQETFHDVLIKMCPGWIKSQSLVRGEWEYEIHLTALVAFARFLKKHINTQCNQLIDITGVDYPSRELRFSIVYHISSVYYNKRIRVKVLVDPVCPVSSITGVYPSAGWFERECWDMFGVFFYNHPDLRRILTDYGFSGHPLRKDFPLSGYVEVCYDDSEKRVISQPVEITQQFRYFDFASPWNSGMERQQ